MKEHLIAELMIMVFVFCVAISIAPVAAASTPRERIIRLQLTEGIQRTNANVQIQLPGDARVNLGKEVVPRP
jgi:hypothetical protein